MNVGVFGIKNGQHVCLVKGIALSRKKCVSSPILVKGPFIFFLVSVDGGVIFFLCILKTSMNAALVHTTATTMPHVQTRKVRHIPLVFV